MTINKDIYSKPIDNTYINKGLQIKTSSLIISDNGLLIMVQKKYL